MPFPFSSSEPGEAWIWGDFVALLQVRPKVVAEVMSDTAGMKSQGLSPMEYPFAMTVFYRKDKNPHGPSNRPILVATLEKPDAAAIIKKFGGQIDKMGIDLKGGASVMECLFTPERHLNFGKYDKSLTLEHARNHLLKSIGSSLSLSGDPVKIGNILAVYGHPNTGWPAQEAKKTSFGCLSIVAVLSVLAIVCAFLFAH